MPEPKIEQLLSPNEVAKMLRVGRRTVLETLLRPGGIWPYYKINERVIRIPASSVLEFLKRRRNV